MYIAQLIEETDTNEQNLSNEKAQTVLVLS